jgi:hypothetical protein
MRGPFFPGLPNWVLLASVSVVIVLVTLVGPARSRPTAPPADYDQLSKRYELMARVTGAIFCLGVFWGLGLAIKLDYRNLHYGIAGGVASFAAICYLALAIRMNPDRSWSEYLRYEDLHRGAPLKLPALVYIYMLFGFIVWGVVSAAFVAFGS